MDVVLVARPDTFLREAEPLLLADEARHNLILGIAGAVRDGFYDEYRLWLVRESGRVVAAAIRTPPFNLILAQPASDAALEALADELAGEALPGVTGAVPEVERFAELFAARSGREPRRTTSQGVFELDEVVPPPQPTGGVRVTDERDRGLAVRWFRAFAAEVAHEGGPGVDRAEANVEQRLSSMSGGILLWEDEGATVSLAGWGGPTPNGIRIGPVYTPPELRGRGYATALTAELSQRLLDGRLFAGGRRFCFLYTDLANPTSNAIYERIGYRRVCESAEYRFV
jgi:uncharacterized protein